MNFTGYITDNYVRYIYNPINQSTPLALSLFVLKYQILIFGYVFIFVTGFDGFSGYIK